jgi:hypothetical protein
MQLILFSKNYKYTLLQCSGEISSFWMGLQIVILTSFSTKLSIFVSSVTTVRRETYFFRKGKHEFYNV